MQNYVRHLSAADYTREIFQFAIHWSIFKTLARYRTSFIALLREIDIVRTLDTILHFIDHNSIYKIEVSQWKICLLLAQLNFAPRNSEIYEPETFFFRHASSDNILVVTVPYRDTMVFLRFAFGAYLYKAWGKRFNGPTYTIAFYFENGTSKILTRRCSGGYR